MLSRPTLIGAFGLLFASWPGHARHAAAQSAECIRPPSRLELVASRSTLAPGGIAGRVTALDGKSIPGGYVVLVGDSSRYTPTDSSGRFQITGMPAGRYRLRVRGIGFQGVDTAITLPLVGQEVVARLGEERDEAACFVERELAKEPALTLARPETVTVERSLADGSRLRHTVVARMEGDVIRFNSRVVNVGTIPTEVVRLCSPKATGDALRIFYSVGPACYGSTGTLAPGETAEAATGGPLRGPPGRYAFRVHPIDPATLDATFSLDLVALRRR